MNIEKAKLFADDWIDSWNRHDIDRIMSHYSDDIEFRSPFIPLLKFNDTGIITNKVDLKKYFEIGLGTYPNLHFTFHKLFTGLETLVIHYTSVNDRQALEVFEFNETGKVTRVYCNYGVAV